MGSGATLVDGVRRWFQRRSSTSSSSNFIANNSNKPSYSSENRVNDGHDSVREESELTIVEDFDISGLKLIKVPIRTHLKFGPMQTQKKVSFDFSHSFRIWVFLVFGF